MSTAFLMCLKSLLICWSFFLTKTSSLHDVPLTSSQYLLKGEKLLSWWQVATGNAQAPHTGINKDLFNPSNVFGILNCLHQLPTRFYLWQVKSSSNKVLFNTFKNTQNKELLEQRRRFWFGLVWALTAKMYVHVGVLPLFPLMKASPYLFLSCPFTYSSVCSMAMFM